VNPAVVTLAAVIAAIALSIISRINVGLVALGLAWVVGVYVAGLDAETVVRGFPGSLFLTLTGVTLLFGAAEANGTLERLAHRGLQLVRGNPRLLPVLFFGLAFLISTVGPGAILSVALVAPLAMVVGIRAGVPAFLIALMVANGANAGNLSPVSAVGVVANTKMAEVGLSGHEARVWFANFAVHLALGLAAYLLFGGVRNRTSASPPSPERETGDEPLNWKHRMTLAVVLTWIVGVLAFEVSLGLSAFAATALLVAARATDEGTALRRVPWGVIVMVCGVTVLIALLEATGGMDLFTTLLARLATPDTVNGVIAFVTGAISTYSSTSGVVLPAFLPTAPGVVAKLGGGDPLAVALSINVGASVVDVSPLSTLGALCLAAAPPNGSSGGALFRRLLLWGVSMTVVGALLCQLFAGPLATWGR
jgi:di/tricarboxylate transporter